MSMTQIELDALGFFFRTWPDEWDLEQVLDAHHENHPRVELWVMFESLDPSEISEAVNGLLHLIRRIKKQGGIL